ncbi:MAG: hypothetical protein AABX93_02995 [Nanoarchaeota archaeon]
MAREDFQSYMNKQANLRKKTGERFNTAHRILFNISETNSFSDAGLMIHNLDYHQIMNKDPVVQKLEKIGSRLLDNCAWASGIRMTINNRYLADISNRQMTEEVYRDLLETPSEVLVRRWTKEFEGKYQKTA